MLPREAELAAQFSVSRQAMREALKVLAAKGLVVSRRRTGTMCCRARSWNLFDPDVLAWHPPERLTPAFLADLVELRRVIEPAAAEFAAARGSREGDRRHRRRAGQTCSARSTTARPSTAPTPSFTSAIFAASGNELFERLSSDPPARC